MDSKKPQVLFLPKWYPNRLDEFDGNFIENHARAIAAFADIAVIFIHSDELNGNSNYEVLQSAPFGYPEIRVYFRKPSFSLLQLEKAVTLYRYWRAQRKAWKIYRRKYGTPDLTHVHVLTRSALLALFLKKVKGIPYIISEHWSGYFKESGAYRGAMKKIFTKMVVRNASVTTVVSDYLRKAMQSHGLTGNYEIIPNVVATDIFKPVLGEEQNAKKKIIHVSTLDVVPKNLPRILEVIAKLRSYRDDFSLDIYGDGPDRPVIEKKITELKLDHAVTLHGNVPQAEVAVAIADSDVLVLFSLYENQPCVMIEAWSAGTPVIAPRIGGIPEHLDAKKGMLIEKSNLAELENALNNVLDNKLEVSPSGMREYALENFSEEKVGQCFLNVYLKVLKRSSASDL